MCIHVKFLAIIIQGDLRNCFVKIHETVNEKALDELLVVICLPTFLRYFAIMPLILLQVHNSSLMWSLCWLQCLAKLLKGKEMYSVRFHNNEMDNRELAFDTSYWNVDSPSRLKIYYKVGPGSSR